MQDLIKTIGDNDDVADYSENSDEEVDFQPSKMKKKLTKGAGFDTDFQFVSSVAEYNRDTWDDLKKYVKRKAKTKTDDKILLIRQEKDRQKLEEAATASGKEVGTIDLESDGDSEDNKVDGDSDDDAEESDAQLDLSDDELVKDNIRLKVRKGRKAELKEEEVVVEDDNELNKDFFEDAPPFDESISFYEMNLSRPLLKAIAALNYVHPTPIQAATVPVALLGRDVCGCAATGTGKTAAFMLPTLERLLFRPLAMAATRALVLVPTRELGVQVYQVTRQLAQFTGIEVALSVGGLDLKAQEAALRKTPDIVIATPGRLIDHVKNTPTFSLASIEVLILDEADRMLDAHFAEQMKCLIRECARTRQTLLFSATMTEQVNELAAVSLSKPVRIFVDNNRDVALNLRQEFIRIRADREADREALLAALVCRTFHDHVMVFVQTKKQAHRLHVLLGLLGVKAGELHGNLTQPQRLEALDKFKAEQLAVLVATDVAARGLDIRGVKTVINFTLPATLEHYIHRVGRTARAGRSGVSVSLAGENERRIVREVAKKARNPVKQRIIPPDIVAKWRVRVAALERDIKQILQEEWEERAVQKAENQAAAATKMLDGTAERPRDWFQSAKQRKEEKERFLLSEPLDKRTRHDNHVPVVDGDAKGKAKKKRVRGARGKGGASGGSAEDRVQNELSKVAALQARLAKNKGKPKKLRAVPHFDKPAAEARAGAKRKVSSFTNDLTDTSRKGAKRMRYDANKKQNDAKRPGGGFGAKVNHAKPAKQKPAKRNVGKQKARR